MVVQIAQPKPLTLTLSSNEVTSESIGGALERSTCQVHQQDHALHVADTNKRLYSMRSPMKLTSPRPKKFGQNRTGVILPTPQVTDSTVTTSVQYSLDLVPQTQLDLTVFKLTKDEKGSLTNLREVSNNYILLKLATMAETKPIVDFQTFFTLSKNIAKGERSNIIY